jgi:bifunctional enzyme CysN/CysC
LKKTKRIKPVTYWFTGLSGAGKTTIARSFERYLIEHNIPVYVIDGDVIREGLSSDLKFSEQDRAENVRRVAEVAKILNQVGILVITSLISPLSKDRLNAKKIIGEQSYIEVYINTPLEVCQKRDVKGLYRKALLGHVKDFTGISSAYDKPTNPDLLLDTSLNAIEDATKTLAKHYNNL